MSAKWVRSQQWDQRNLTGLLTPVRWVLHALSSITLAVILLVGVSIYGILASVPIGLLALAPTYLIYGITLLVTVALIAGLPAWGVWRASGKFGFGTRFSLTLLTTVVLAVFAAWVWYLVGWPVLRYDETTGRGLRLFASFVHDYKAVSVRRTPALEMTELQFYGWWPIKALLLLFVLNMTVATLRRIEFNLANLGVLTVHSGIVLLGLGSAVYSVAKQEGDVLLLAGPPDPSDKSGKPTLGQMETGFFDNTRVVLRARQARTMEEQVKLGLPPDVAWDQRMLVGVPRYNDYGLGVVTSLQHTPSTFDRGRTLDLPVPPGAGPAAGMVDPDIQFRVVGYAAAAELEPAWTETKAQPGGVQPPDQPLRYIELLTSIDSQGQAREDGVQRLRETWGMMPTVPSERVVEKARVLGVEYTRNLSDERWNQLTVDIPLPHDLNKQPVGALIVDIPGHSVSRLYPIEPGAKIDVSGYTLEFTRYTPRPPFPVITPGFENASSSVAIVRVTPPNTDGSSGKPFDRYLYSRFPELTQDLSTTDVNSRGMPARTPPSKDISLTFIDASMVQVHMDERPDGTVRGFVRLPLPKGTSVIRFDGLKQGDSIPVGPQLSLRLGSRLASVQRVNIPRVITGPEREKDLGTHKQAAIAVEVSAPASTDPKLASWKSTVWLPFQLYAEHRIGSTTMPVTLPDGRTVEIAFGRLWRPLPGLALQLSDFEMMPYPHSTQPQDFRSDLLVTKFDSAGQVVATERRATSLNEPLLESPFTWDQAKGPVANAAGWFGSVLGDTRFKFSQSGWDSGGWTDTKARADAGDLPRPYGRFTILGVGNNPGIKIIALGAVLTCVGIPWAFYIKPWMIRRRKAALAQAAAEGRLKPHPASAGRHSANDPIPAPSAMEVNR